MRIDTGTGTVTAEVADGVGTITLNRPERRNALHPEMYDAVPRLIERFTDDPAVGCLLVTAAGSAFCAGGDVRGSGRPDPQAPEPSVADAAAALAHDARMVVLLYECPKITIAALPGPAAGAGIGIALAADLRIAARSARLVPAWSDLAFSGDFGGPWLLARQLGCTRAIDVLLHNTTIEADEALALGLYQRVVDDVDLPSAAVEWARRIAAGPRDMQRFVKENVQQAAGLSLAAALPLESERMVRSRRTDAHRAAVTAWVARAAAKRAANDPDGSGT